MVESKYNYLLQQEDSILLLNGISGAILNLKKDEYEFLNQLFKDPLLQKEHAEVTHNLLAKKIMVADTASELELLKKKYRQSKSDGTFQLILNPTQNCNFNCWYCYETHPKGYMQPELINRIKKLLSSNLQRKNIHTLSLGWFGGEPLMYFHKIVYDISLYAKQEAEKNKVEFKNSMTTNGYLLNSQIIEKAHQIDLKVLQVTLDGDRKTHDSIRNCKGKPSFDRIIENCIRFCEYHETNRVRLRINYTDESLKIDYQEALNRIPLNIRRQVGIDFQRVWQTRTENRDIQKGKKWLLDNRNRLKENDFIVAHPPQFSIYKGCKCYADKKEYLNINYDGHIYRCTAENYSPATSLGYLNEQGEIIWYNSEINRIDDKPYFENEKCIQCKYLALCGGPCYKGIKNYIQQKTAFCALNSADTDLSTFIKEYYQFITSKKTSKTTKTCIEEP